MLKYVWESWTTWLLPPQVLQAGSESSFIAGSGPRGPWPAGHRTSSSRRLATWRCWACRRWGCPQLRIPRPANVSSRPPGGRDHRWLRGFSGPQPHLCSSSRSLTCLDFHTSSTGMPAMMELGSSCAAEFTVSLAPITRVKSVSGRRWDRKLVQYRTCQYSDQNSSSLRPRV